MSGRHGFNVTTRTIQAAYLGSLIARARHFERATRELERYQTDGLRALLRDNHDTAYGEAHGFSGIDSVAQYQARVPIVDYEHLSPFIDRIAKGELKVLTSEAVVMMERSGGSTSTNKLIPYTAGLLAEFSAATAPWFSNLFGSDYKLWGTQQYWSVSQARARTTTEGGIPIGFESDEEYFGPVSRWAMSRLLAVPGTVARIVDVEVWRRETLRRLLQAEDLGLISVWSPSFLTLLMDAMKEQLPDLLRGLPAKRAASIHQAIDKNGLVGEALWPRLALISLWCDGPSAGFLPALRSYFPKTPFQPKGLLATEGVVSFPLAESADVGAALAVTSHFLEFIDLEKPSAVPLLAHELRVGGHYSPVLSTRGGFYRYHLKDVVRCTGMHRNVPLIRFESKLDRVSDVCGEKIHAHQVDQALALATAELRVELDFALLAPLEGEPPRYCLFVESAVSDAVLTTIAARIEAHLSTGHHYRYCREIGQLGQLTWRRVQRGQETYLRTLEAEGARLGDIKPTHLDARMSWGSVFQGNPSA